MQQEDGSRLDWFSLIVANFIKAYVRFFIGHFAH